VVTCFLQPEAGMRGDLVTGVQTCALPILAAADKDEILSDRNGLSHGSPLMRRCPPLTPTLSPCPRGEGGTRAKRGRVRGGHRVKIGRASGRERGTGGVGEGGGERRGGGKR